MALGHHGEDLHLSVGKFVEGPPLPAAAEETADDARIDDALTRADSPERVGQDGRVVDPLLEHVSGAGRVVLEQRGRVARLQVARQQQNRGAGMPPADDIGRLQALVGMRGRHLAVVWPLAAAGVTGGNGAELANDLALVAAAFVLAAGWARGGWLQGAINALVIELGPSQHAAAPVSALLANALADPELDVRYSVPGLGWFDENGLRVTAPSGDTGHLTRVATPDGGEVVLVHGPAAAAGPALAEAAATAAALAMESARLGAEVRQQADTVRESRRRLLAVADAERQALETRLRAGPVGRLRRVDETLAGIADQTAHDIRGQAAIALDDLVRLARRLYPGALGTQPFRKVVRDLAEAMPAPVRVVTHGQLADLPEAHQALAYFFCSECLTNVARHSGASSATVRLRVGGERLLISVLDDGQGGATMGRSRGLRGLADRVEVARGQLTVDSPPGGPTCIRADIPLTPPA